MNEGPHNKLRLGELFYVADAKSRFRHSIDNIFLSFNANFQALQIEKRKNDSFTQFWLASSFFFFGFSFSSPASIVEHLITNFALCIISGRIEI